MSKVKTVCEICDGTYDGTPSGLKKHQATAKHRSVPVAFIGTTEAEAMVASANGSTFAEAVEKHTEQDASTVIQKVAAPDPYAVTDDEFAAFAERNRINEAIGQAEQRIKKYTADRKWRETRAPHLVGKYDTLIDTEQQSIDLWTVRKNELTAIIDEGSKARDEATRTFWNGIGAELEEMFSTAYFPLVIRTGYDGAFDLLLATGKVIDGPHGQYPETRSGFEVSLTAPENTWSDTAKGATIRWSSLSQMTLDDAEVMIRLHTIGLAAARYLDERIDVPTK